jgi:hypothetical protein
MNIFITGIHGFGDSNLVQVLSISNIIYGLDITFSQKDGIVHTYSWDELESIPPVDVVAIWPGKLMMQRKN